MGRPLLHHRLWFAAAVITGCGLLLAMAAAGSRIASTASVAGPAAVEPVEITARDVADALRMSIHRWALRIPEGANFAGFYIEYHEAGRGLVEQRELLAISRPMSGWGDDPHLMLYVPGDADHPIVLGLPGGRSSIAQPWFLAADRPPASARLGVQEITLDEPVTLLHLAWGEDETGSFRFRSGEPGHARDVLFRVTFLGELPE